MNEALGSMCNTHRQRTRLRDKNWYLTAWAEATHCQASNQITTKSTIATGRPRGRAPLSKQGIKPESEHGWIKYLWSSWSTFYRGHTVSDCPLLGTFNSINRWILSRDSSEYVYGSGLEIWDANDLWNLLNTEYSLFFFSFFFFF